MYDLDLYLCMTLTYICMFQADKANISDLFVDLRDGVKLLALLEVLCGLSLVRFSLIVNTNQWEFMSLLGIIYFC